MTEPLDVLDQIEACAGKNEKLNLLKSHAKNQKLADLLDAALNYNRRYFIKAWSEQPAGDGHQGKSCDAFFQLLDWLERRNARSDETEQRVSAFMAKCTKQQCKWYSRVIRQDLRAGFSVDTAVKAGFDIPTFSVQLAIDAKKVKKLDKFIKAGLWMSPKMDGYRCLAVIRDGDVVLYSRNGTVFENFPTIKDALSGHFPSGRHVLDGEIMSDSFNDMQKSAFASVRGTTVGDVKYHVFDKIPYDEWESQQFDATFDERLTDLMGYRFNLNPALVIVQHALVNTIEQAVELERHYVELGFEGAMGKPPGPYHLDRQVGGLMKFKSMLTQDCRIVDFYEGKGRLVGRLGGLVVTQENGQTCEVGSGFSDTDRDEIWKNKNNYSGRIVEIQYQELTQDNIMRFPIFLRWRTDKDGRG